jgi:hypothetical protein
MAKSLERMVDAAGIEPATPAMSTRGPGVVTFAGCRNRLEELSLCSPGVPALSQGEVHGEPRGTVVHGTCCAALALWVLGDEAMARQAAKFCNEGENYGNYIDDSRPS